MLAFFCFPVGKPHNTVGSECPDLKSGKSEFESFCAHKVFQFGRPFLFGALLNAEAATNT